MFPATPRRPFLFLAALCAPLFVLSCGGDGGGGGTWYATCGDPVCRTHQDHPGVARCTTQMAGQACAALNDQCDPVNDCNSLLLCATRDPKTNPGGCPISRRRYKEDIRYLSGPDLLRYSDELHKVRLATYEYKGAAQPGRRHLGFVIEDQEQSMAVDPERDMVDLYGYTSMAVAALKVQAAEIEALKREVADLKQRLSTGGRPRRHSAGE